MITSRIDVNHLLDELLAVEKEYPGGSARSWALRKEIETATGELATTGEWITGFWKRHKIYEHFGWPVPKRP